MRETGQRSGVPPCDLCSRPSVIYLYQSRGHLCGDHFARDLESRVFGCIEKNAMIQNGDRIAVALSGGKDSTAVLFLLSRYLKGRKGAGLVAVTIDEGISGYRDGTIQAARQAAERAGVGHSVISFRDLFGKDLDTLLAGRAQEACTVCGILRKKALVMAAEQQGATKIATGHNLDDEAQSVLMNLLRGDMARLVRDSAVDNSGRFLPRIKPLAEIPEKEIAAYLWICGMFLPLPECPYAVHAMRREVRKMLSVLERGTPGTAQNLIESKKALERYLDGAPLSGSMNRCRQCGDPCSGNLCQVCRIRRSLGC